MDAQPQRGDDSLLILRGNAPAARPGVRISLVLPVRDAEKSLARIVLAADEALTRVTNDYEIVLVDGGSHDGTLAVAAATARMVPALRVLEQPALGPGAKCGQESAANYEYVALTTTNAILEAQDLERLVLVAPHCQLVSGTPGRDHEGWMRRLVMRTYNVAADVLLATSVRDSQSAVKFARRETMLAPRADRPERVCTYRDARHCPTGRSVGRGSRSGSPPARSTTDPISLRDNAATIREALQYWWTTSLFPAADAPDEDDRARPARFTSGTSRC